MSGSTSILDLISQSQASKEVTANALFDAASPAMLFGRRASTTAALTWGYYGGVVIVAGVPTQVSNGTLTLTAAVSNYIEYTLATGVLAVNTTVYANDAAWFAALKAAGKLPVYKIITGASTVSSYVDWRYQGLGAVTVYAPAETPSGAINGTNSTYTLAHTPIGSITYSVNGVIQEEGVDFTITGNTITKLAPLLIGGVTPDRHRVQEYRI